MEYWLFQGNPKYYRLLDAIRERATIPWKVTRYGKRMKIGDGVLIWVTGEKRGIYALGKIIQEPQIITVIPDVDYFIDPTQMTSKPQVIVQLTDKLLDHPLLYQDIESDPVLRQLWVICKPPVGTNFTVTAEQWQRVQALKQS